MATHQTPETPNPYERTYLPHALLESVPQPLRSRLIDAEVSENVARNIAEAYASVHGISPELALAVGRAAVKRYLQPAPR